MGLGTSSPPPLPPIGWSLEAFRLGPIASMSLIRLLHTHAHTHVRTHARTPLPPVAWRIYSPSMNFSSRHSIRGEEKLMGVREEARETGEASHLSFSRCPRFSGDLENDLVCHCEWCCHLLISVQTSRETAHIHPFIVSVSDWMLWPISTSREKPKQDFRGWCRYWF